MAADRFLAGQMAIGKLLALGSLRELWTLEDLDQPGPGTRELHAAIRRAAINRGESPPPYRNLAREWMAANPREWDEILRLSCEAEDLSTVLPTGPEIIAAVAGVSAAQSRFRS